MRINIRHETRYDYAEPAAGVVMRLRLRPASANAQRVERWNVRVNGELVERWIINGYGDAEALWRAHSPVDFVEIVAEGDVKTFDCAGVFRRPEVDARPAMYLRTTGLTAPNAELAALGQEASSAEGALASLHALCGLVHERVAWRAGLTTVETTAAEAYAHRGGVCQDQAHIFIAAARSLGIPARYVHGYLRDAQRPDSDHDPHAWVEAWVEGIGWIGFDCSLGHCPVDGHVRVSSGLDAWDAAPIRGVFRPTGETRLSHDVQIANLPPQDVAQVQSQQ